jgi:hypothetical protein
VFVEANEKEAKVDKANLIITDETRIRRKRGDSEIEATFEQLKVGDEIEARFVEGPILMIYPMRAAVSAMLIVKTVDAGQDQDKKKQTERQSINPNDLSAPGSYTHVVVANQRKLIFVSGQVSLNKQGEVVGKGDLRAQATQVFENLKNSPCHGWRDFRGRSEDEYLCRQLQAHRCGDDKRGEGQILRQRESAGIDIGGSAGTGTEKTF